MSVRPATLVVLTTGLIAAAGLTSGCQVPKVARSWEPRPLPWTWRQNTEHPRAVPDDRAENDVYVPEVDDVPNLSAPTIVPQTPPTRTPTIPQRPNPELPTEPALPPEPEPLERPEPVPPAVDVEAPQVRRWKPARPNGQPSAAPHYTNESESNLDDFHLPPARVTYSTEANSEEPTITPDPTHTSSSQPRLFRPAGSAKNMFDTVKRKLSR